VIDPEYDPLTGVFSRAGKPVGTVNAAGYVVLRYRGQLVYAHRLAMHMTTGAWPPMVDHVNGRRADNRIENLRAVRPTGNSVNRTAPMKAGGAYFHKASGKWRSSICYEGVQHHMGYFASRALAVEAYELAVQLRNEKEFTRA
jgi:hypothetical protein